MEKVVIRKYLDKTRKEYRYEIKLPNGKVYDFPHAGDAFNLVLGYAEFSANSEIILKSTEDR